MDQVSVECAASGVDLAVLRELGEKDVMFGAIDVGTEEVEICRTSWRIAFGGPFEHVPAERLFPCTDCGLVPRSREASRGKMRALAEGAAIVRAELTSTKRRELAVP